MTKKEEKKSEYKSGLEYQNHITNIFCEWCLIFSTLYLLLYIIILFIS
jgi:hypothetical protein